MSFWEKIIKWGSIFYALGWIIKIFIQTAFQIFVVNVYHQFTEIIRRNPFDTLMYEQAVDRGHYIDEYNVLRELALNIGRVVMLMLIFILLFFVPLNLVFLLAATASLLISLL